jgi:putative transposase
MVYDRFRDHRRSIRLKGHDYTAAGAYYITICTWDRGCLFGEIDNGEMQLNESGLILQCEWLHTPLVRSYVELDAFIIMPNHIHGIIIIRNTPDAANAGNIDGVMVGATRRVAPTDPDNISGPSTQQVTDAEKCMPRGPQSGSIGAMIGQFKSMATKRINAIRVTPGSPVWQRGYYERIIRNQSEFDRIRHYIINNPLNWTSDIEHPPNAAGTTGALVTF